MKLFKYISLIILTGLFAACSDDLAENQPYAAWQGDGEDVVISISSEDMLPVNMNASRTSGSEALDGLMGHIADLNIRVHTDDGGYTTFFARATNFADILVNGGSNTVDAALIDNPPQSRPHSKTIHCGKDIQASHVVKIEAISNRGTDLSGVADWSTLYTDEPVSHRTTNCQMYGKWEKGVDLSPVANTHGGLAVPCKLYTMQIRRSLALVTVKLVNNGLNPGVVIKPLRFRLCNVPDRCQLTALGHKDLDKPGVTETGNRINVKGKASKLDIASVPVGIEHNIYEGALTEGVSSIGNHIKEGDVDLPEQFYPMYMYENTQGVHANANGQDHKTKYPAGYKTVEQVKNGAETYKYSYVEVEAEYKYTVQGAVKASGSIIYRFFLGANAYDNFDVEGNHYYKLTLNLKGFGGAKEDGKTDADGNLVVNDADASWRVDMNTTDWGFEKNFYEFDSHFIDGTANVVGGTDVWELAGVKSGDGSASWLAFEVQTPNDLGVEWVNPTKQASKYPLKIKDGKLNFQVQPLTYSPGTRLDPEGGFDENTFKQAKNYREMTIVVKNKQTQQTVDVVVRQYAPIPFVVNGILFFMERFEENYPNKIGHAWNYEGVNLKTEGSKLHDENGLVASDVGKSLVFKEISGEANYRMRMGVHTSLLSFEQDESSFGIIGWKPSWKCDFDTYDKVVNGQKVRNSGYASAAHVCYRKGKSKFQGADTRYYVLPDSAMMVAMMEYNDIHQPEWGTFEMMHIYDDYWTAIISADGLGTKFYNGKTGEFEYTRKRSLDKRVRAVYTYSDFAHDVHTTKEALYGQFAPSASPAKPKPTPKPEPEPEPDPKPNKPHWPWLGGH